MNLTVLQKIYTFRTWSKIGPKFQCQICEKNQFFRIKVIRQIYEFGTFLTKQSMSNFCFHFEPLAVANQEIIGCNKNKTVIRSSFLNFQIRTLILLEWGSVHTKMASINLTFDKFFNLFKHKAINSLDSNEHTTQKFGG